MPRYKLSETGIVAIAEWIQAGVVMPPDPPAK
jgi:hypothetical protein